MSLELGTWSATPECLSASLGSHDLQVTCPSTGVLRVSFHPAGHPWEPSPAVAAPDARLPFSVVEDRDRLHLHAPGLTLTITRSPLRFTLGDADGKPLTEDLKPVLEAGVWRLEAPLAPETRCYGLGEKTGFLDKRGRRYTMWNTDDPSPHIETLDPLYVSIPWAILFTKGLAAGIYLDDPAKTVWDVGRTASDRLTVMTPRPGLDLYLVAGPGLGQVVERYTAVTGRMPMPPIWAIGFQQSRWSYDSADRMREVVREYRERGIPLDVLYADIDYMDGYRVFTWNPETFSDPAALMADLRADGIRVVPIVDPGVKKDGDYPVFAEGVDGRHFVKDHDGLPLVGEVWPGPVCFPDFANPEVRRWWGDWHEAYLEAGVAGIWCDMNEPSLFDSPTKTMPLDARHGADGSLTHDRAHNLYGSWMAQATREGLARLRPNERPFVLSRAGFAGIQRHAAVWTGDNFSIWAHLEQSLPMAMNMGLSGLAFVGPDVGGFSGDCVGELLARWTQVGAFTPFFRNHAAKGTCDQEPWVFGPEVEEVCRRYIRMRYAWLPYLYTAFWRASQWGEPILRPLVYDYPDDPEVFACSDQAMVGPDLMLAPVVRPGVRKRLVYLPRGEWIDFWTGDRLMGGKHLPVDAPLERLPLFVRAGAILPRGPWAPCVDRLNLERLTLHVYPAATMAGTWYDDDGASMAYAQGGYNLWTIVGTRDGQEIRLTLQAEQSGYASPTRELRIVIHGVGGASEVASDGASADWRMEGADLVIEAPMAPATWTVSGLA